MFASKWVHENDNEYCRLYKGASIPLDFVQHWKGVKQPTVWKI